MLKRLDEALGDKLAHGLKPLDLVNFASDRRHQGAAPYTVLMDVSKLGTVLRYAGAGLGLPDVVGQARPLLNHAGLIGGGGKRERRPTDDELSRIVAALPSQYRKVIEIMIAIGLRRGEVCRLRWEDLDRERKLILVRNRKDPRQKVGNDQWIPLIRGAWEIVCDISLECRVGYISPVHPQTLSKVFKITCDKLCIIDLHLHDLRHEAISQMFESGMSIEQVALVSGHKDWRHLKRYTNLRPESLHSLADHQDTEPRRARLRIVAPGPRRS
jgi:integrase